MALPLGYTYNNTLSLDWSLKRSDEPASISQGSNSECDKTASNIDPIKKRIMDACQGTFQTNEQNKIEPKESKDPEEKRARRRESDKIRQAKKRKENEELKEENGRLTAENETLKMQNAQLWDAFSYLNESRPLLIRQIEIIASQKCDLSSQVDSLKNEIIELEEKNFNLQKELGQWNEMEVAGSGKVINQFHLR